MNSYLVTTSTGLILNAATGTTNVSTVTVPDGHVATYDEGYEDGMSDATTEWVEALDAVLPDHIYRTPFAVAEYLRALSESAR